MNVYNNIDKIYSHTVDKLFNLISILNKSKIKNKEEFKELKILNPDVYHFFNFIDNEKTIIILEEIKKNCEIVFKKYFNINIKNHLNLKEDDYFYLQAVFSVKSLKKSNFEMMVEIKNNITSDNIILNHYKYEKNYWIFETNKLYNNEYNFKKELFRLYSILALKKIITEKISIEKTKTYKNWLINYEDFEYSEIDKFKISFSPYKILNIDGKIFLSSSFFSNTVEVFKKNNYSSKSFKLNRNDYLEKTCNIPVYLDVVMFDKIYNKYENYLVNIEEKIKNCVNKIKINREEIEIYLGLNKEMYKINIIEKVKRDIIFFNEKNILISILVFIKNWLDLEFTSLYIKNNKIKIIFKKYEKEIENNINDINLKKILDNKKEEILYILEENYNNNDDDDDDDDDEIKKFVEENFKKILEHYKNLRLIKEENNKYGKEMIEIRKLEKEGIEMRADLSKLYSINNLKLLNSIKSRIENKPLYFPFHFDFRGRMYFSSSIGITNYKLSRYFFNYGDYSEKEIIELSKVKLPEINSQISKIYSICKIFGIYRKDSCIYECIFWCLIALGKEFIVKNRSSISCNHIFHIGYIKLTKENLENDIENWIIIEHYKNIISSLKEKIIKKRFIHKDATASFIQNTIRIIGPKNLESLEYSNLISRNVWYDTYTLALESWKNSIKKKNEIIIDDKKIDLKKLHNFIRTTVKKPIMVDAYEATYLTQWDYFVNEVKKKNGVDIKYNTEEEILFKNFIKFLNNFWNEYFLYKDSDIMIRYAEAMIKSDKEIKIFLSDSESDMTYYNIVSKTIDIKIKIDDEKIRKTKIYNKIDEKSINDKKTSRAIKPNWVHLYDAYLIRQINNKLSSFKLSIHDCCLVDCLGVTIFIETANKCFKELDENSITENKDLFKEINGIFIFI